jgi:PAS domain S-box-containing protein
MAEGGDAPGRRPPRRSAGKVARYVLAASGVVLAAFLTLLVSPAGRPGHFGLFYAVIAIIAAVAGRGPAVLAVAGSIVAAAFLLQPLDARLPGLITFSAVAITLSWLIEMLRQAQARLRAQAQRLALLEDLSQALADAGLEYNELLNVAARKVADLIGDACIIRLLSPDGAWLQMAAAHHRDPQAGALLRELTARPQLANEGLGGQVLASRQALLVPAITQAEMLALAPASVRPYYERYGAASTIWAPLVCGDRAHGVIGILRDKDGPPYGTADLTLLRQVAARAATALDAAYLYRLEQTARRTAERAGRRLRALQTASAALLEALTPTQAAEAVLQQAAAELGAEWGSLWLMAPGGQALELPPSGGPPELVAQARLPLDSHQPQAVAVRTGRPVWAESAEQLSLAVGPPGEPQVPPGTQALAALPLAAEGRRLGCLAVGFRSARVFSPAERDFMLALAGMCADAVARTELYAALEARVHERTAELKNSLAERTLAESRFRDLLEAAPDAIVIADENQVIRLINEQAEAVFGYSRDELVGESLLRLVPERFIDVFQGIWRRVAAGQGRTFRLGQDLSLLACRRDGSEFPVEVSASPLRTASGLLVMSTVRDVTERQQAQQQQQRFSAYLSEQLERERSRLARQAHDELGQALTGLRIDLQQLERLATDPAAASARRKRMLADIDALIETVRAIASELRPSVLDDLGLLAAVEWLCDDFETRSGIYCELNVEIGEFNISPEAATAAFRVMQEAFTNIIRHAQATSVTVTLQAAGEAELLLRVSDNGVGLRPGALTNGRSLGIMGMRERLQAVGGHLDIASTPGQGTTVSIYIPMGPPPAT